MDLSNVVEFLGRWTSEQGGGSTKKDNLHSFECVDVSGIRLKLIRMFYSVGPKSGLRKCMCYFVNSHLILDKSI